jgi:hypothetical protein
VSIRLARRFAAAAFCFVLLTAQTCEELSFSDIARLHSATITVENTASEVVFVVLYADDAFEAGNLATGQTHKIVTRIDGIYNVVASGSGTQLGNYQSSLQLLRTATHDLYAHREADDPRRRDAAIDRTRTAKQNLSSLFQPELTLASCSGTIRFPLDILTSPRPMDASATVTKSGDAWGASCPSST